MGSQRPGETGRIGLASPGVAQTPQGSILEKTLVTKAVVLTAEGCS